jgi:hypothetical protein
MKKKITRGAVVKKLDAAFSQYIRIKDARMGDATCVTCGVTKPWKELQNGHFYTRGRYPTRWDETNCHVQCMRCNVMLKGNYIPYTKYMIDRYGREYVDELERISLSTVKYPTPTLMEMLEHYKQEVQRYERGEVMTPLDKTHPWGV